MGFNCGIVGLPNVGKSTLFNAITSAGAKASNFPFCTIEPNIGIVQVPDKRLTKLTEFVQPDKTVPTTLEFVDIAGLVKGASKGEGLGNKFLSHIRQVDAIAHIVRCFDDDNITHVHNRISPKDDIEIIHAELIIADLDTVERRLSNVTKSSRSGDKKSLAEAKVLQKVQGELQKGKIIFHSSLDEDDQLVIKDLHLLTNKPIFYVANVSEDDVQSGNAYVDEIKQLAENENSSVVIISGKLESEIAALDEDEKIDFLKDYGLECSGLDQMINVGYKLLDQITYFTAGKIEVRAWTIKNETLAPQAAGVIHTDFERGFIKAEVISYEDFVNAGSETAAKEQGKMRLEGKAYKVQDGDIMHFKFNV